MIFLLIDDDTKKGGVIMNFISIIVVLALFATIATLVWGVGSMAFGGSYDDEHSEQFMSVRIWIQGIAFVLILLAVAYSF